MEIGKLNRVVTIQAPATGQNSYGEPNVGWTDFAIGVPASVIDVTGREFLAAAAVQNAAETKVTIRHIDGITSAMRVLHQGTAYNIQAVLGTDRRSLLLMCERGVNLG